MDYDRIRFAPDFPTEGVGSALANPHEVARPFLRFE